jgi:hypothetical protein
MAKQFYRTFQDIVELKQQNEQQLQNRITEINQTTSHSSFEQELAALKLNLKTVAGSNEHQSIEDKFIDKCKRNEFIQQHNIKPGTPRWFRVMYAQPDLTGEDPYGE